jgi:hypothetical protein
MKFKATFIRKNGRSIYGHFMTLQDAKSWARSHGVEGKLIIHEHLDAGGLQMISETKL